VYYIDNLCR